MAGSSAVGGGAAPGVEVPTTLVTLAHPARSAGRLAADLRASAERFHPSARALVKRLLEFPGEVEEAADLIRYYAQTMADNNGFDHPMDNLGDPSVHTRSILRPHGVFAVISPFNFPMALSTGPVAAALMAGNTAILKPASAAPLSSVNLIHALVDAGVPAGFQVYYTRGANNIGNLVIAWSYMGFIVNENESPEGRMYPYFVEKERNHGRFVAAAVAVGHSINQMSANAMYAQPTNYFTVAWFMKDEQEIAECNGVPPEDCKRD